MQTEKARRRRELKQALRNDRELGWTWDDPKTKPLTRAQRQALRDELRKLRG